MTEAMTTSLPALWHPVVQQQAYRQIMHACSRPGEICRLQHDALLLTLATLLDGATTLADPCGLVSGLDMARLETSMVEPERAQFVLARGDVDGPAFSPCLGTLESPESGATVLLHVAALDQGVKLHLGGPGIVDTREIAVQGMNPAWLAARREWNSAFPMGVDMLLLAGRQLMALPRTTRIEEID